MCGFFLSNDPTLPSDLESVLEKRLTFRGPDFQSSIVQHMGWTLFHSRLSIIATNVEFSQPYQSSTGGLLVFNGEILNYAELARKYSLGSAISDTQVLSRLLEFDKFDLNEIDGFFAFAFIDRYGRLQYCARDRFGVKPLVVLDTGKIISISSEASVLSDLYGLGYNESALEEYRAFRAPILSRSYFSNLCDVEPGTCRITGRFFDSLDYIPEVRSDFDSAMNELEHVVNSSISSRLVSDVPVGLLYSGGIDSNLLALNLDREVTRFTGGQMGDYDMQEAMMRATGNSNVVEVSEDDFRNRFFEMIELRKEPLSVPNEVILSILAEKWAAMGGKVLLSGEAADELFAGYDRIFFWALNAEKFSLNSFLEYYAYVPIDSIDETIKEQLYCFFSNISELSPFEQVRQFFIKFHLPVLFRRLDFSLMYGGIEGREPLASYEVFKVAQKFHPKDLFKGRLGKKPLRTLVSQHMGQEFAFRKKVGFPIEIRRIFTGQKSISRIDNYNSWFNENLEALK